MMRRRRHPVSTCGGSSDSQRPSAAGRLRKRSRLGKPSKVLGGGAVGGVYTSKFSWPYYPMLTDEEILDWAASVRRFLQLCFDSREGSNRNGFLTEIEVVQQDAEIRRVVTRMYDWEDNAIGTFDMLGELMGLFRFSNVFVVTNMTQHTAVRLNRKPLVNTLLKFNCPLILRLEDAFSSEPVTIYDCRPGTGATEENPKESEVFPTPKQFNYILENNILTLVYHLEGSESISFRIEWFGPKECFDSVQRGLLPPWTASINHEDVTDSLQVPAPSTMQELMSQWFPYIEELMKTKERGAHCRLNFMHRMQLQMMNSRTLAWLDRVANGEAVTEKFPYDLHQFMRCVRVVNMTPGTVILLRTTHGSCALRFDKGERINLFPADFLAAELHFTERRDIVYPITAGMVTAQVLEDNLVVTITPTENMVVVVWMDWLGPGKTAPNGQPWDEFLGPPNLQRFAWAHSAVGPVGFENALRGRSRWPQLPFFYSKME